MLQDAKYCKYNLQLECYFLIVKTRDYRGKFAVTSPFYLDF